ncbi:MAG TPA: hypothetical protein EYQ00_15035 [Dehalococcoidia bacterium]|nr:hypothetical protein [Dehalococcoidia bacterium]
MLQKIVVGVSLFLIAGLLVILGFLGRIITEPVETAQVREDTNVSAAATSTQIPSVVTIPEDFLLLDEM